MEKRSDDDLLLANPIQQSVVVHQQFSKRRLADFTYHAAPFRKRGETRPCIKSTGKHLNSTVVGVLRDVGDDLVQGLLGRFGPDYPARPSNHLRRNSASTCS